MRLAVYLPLLLPLLAALTARPIARCLHPRAATWLLTASALALAAASTAALGLLALAGAIRIPLVQSLGHWSAAVVGRSDSADLGVAVSAGLALSVLAIAAGRMAWRRVQALIEAASLARCLPGPDQLVVLDDTAPEAFAVPGRPGRIVVSTGMLDALDFQQREVLYAHERAHLACRHHLFVAVAQLAATANPLLRPLAAAVAFTVERWADEQAACEVGDRQLAAVAVGRAALADRGGPVRAGVVLGILGSLARPATPGPMPRRVAALLAPPPSLTRSRLLLSVAVAALATATCLCAAEAAHDLHQVLVIARTPRH